MVHRSGVAWHVPDISPAPHLELGAYEQNCFSGQRKPAIPPQIFPSGEVRPPGGTAGTLAAGGDVAGSAGGELSTPWGVNTGGGLTPATTLALGVGSRLAVAFGARAPAAGEACPEQPPSAALTDRNATLAGVVNRWCMAGALATHFAQVERCGLERAQKSWL